MNQTKKLLSHFIQFGEIDPMTSLRDLGIYRLASRVYDLRCDGYQIETVRDKESGYSKYIYKCKVYQEQNNG
jgi:hypothetical protein